jgi:ATP-dependent helicase HrpA
VADALTKTLGQILTLHQQLQPQLKTPWAHVTKDIAQQLQQLVYPHFVLTTPWSALQHLPRYLQGMAQRLQKLPDRLAQDQQHTAALANFTLQWQTRELQHRKKGIVDPQLAAFRWQLEELRISLFAQQLKTPQPVSIKRLQKLWESVQG